MNSISSITRLPKNSYFKIVLKVICKVSCYAFFTIITFLFVTSVFGQNNQQEDSSDTRLKNDCGLVFTLSEKMPDLKFGISKFEDTLASYLRSTNEFPSSGHILVRLTILRTGEVYNVEVINSDLVSDIPVIKAIKQLSNQWSPGKQNKKPVCVYRKADIQFLSGKCNVTLFRF